MFTKNTLILKDAPYTDLFLLEEIVSGIIAEWRIDYGYFSLATATSLLVANEFVKAGLPYKYYNGAPEDSDFHNQNIKQVRHLMKLSNGKINKKHSVYRDDPLFKKSTVLVIPDELPLPPLKSNEIIICPPNSNTREYIYPGGRKTVKRYQK